MDIEQKKHRKGVILILISSLMFGSYGVWSRLIGDDFGAFYQGWTRSLALTIILAAALPYIHEILIRKKILLIK